MFGFFNLKYRIEELEYQARKNSEFVKERKILIEELYECLTLVKTKELVKQCCYTINSLNTDIRDYEQENCLWNAVLLPHVNDLIENIKSQVTKEPFDKGE